MAGQNHKQPAVFDVDTAKMVLDAVRRVSGDQQFATNQFSTRRPRAPVNPFFWAKITGNASISGSGGPFKYSYTEQVRNQNGWQDATNPKTGDVSASTTNGDGSRAAVFWAINPGDATGSTATALANGTIVFINVTFDADSFPYYTIVNTQPGTVNVNIVTDVSWDGSNLQETKTPATLFGSTGTPSTTTITGTTDCPTA